MLKEKKIERNSSLELLRIICMLLIIAHHYGYHGNYPYLTYSNFSVSRVFIQILSLLGKMPCQIFALITGYFLITSKSNNYYRKIMKIFLTLLFYSVLILSIVSIFDIFPVGISDIVKALVPVVFDNWYVINYMLLLLFVPYLNMFIHSIDKKTLMKINIIIIIIWSLIPTAVDCLQFISSPWNYGSLDFFVAMYFIGAYIRLYYKRKWDNIYNLLLSLFVLFISIGLVISLDYVAFINQDNRLFSSVMNLGNDNSIIMLIVSIFMFLFFVNMKFENKLINKIAGTTLGIYILHENYFVRRLIWRTILPNYNYLAFPYVHFIGKVVVIFIVCMIIEMLRKKVVANNLDDLIIDKISLWYKKIFKKTRS